MPLPGAAMVLHTTKFDGSLHYRFPVGVVAADADMLAVYRRPGVMMQSYRGEWSSGRHLLCVYWRGRPWNLNVQWDADWAPQWHYVNIASEPSWTSEVVSAVDLDLDLILEAASATPQAVDGAEFLEHAARWNYPADLVERCLRTCAAVGRQMREARPPFDGALFAWRPGLALPPLEAGRDTQGDALQARGRPGR